MSLHYVLEGSVDGGDVRNGPVRPNTRHLKTLAVEILDHIASLRVEESGDFNKKRMRSMRNIRDNAILIAEYAANNIAVWEEYR